ncbi:MAG: hypothetical protein K2J08_13250 [Ruminococcus sp.]|nr:hypothetical protein [Ruminococcus sp.]
MNCYPVIYTRTLNCDYFANFHVLPNFVDANWVLPYIRSATTDMNPANSQIKRIVITNTEVCIFGIIAYAKDVVGSGMETCFRDNKGRAVYGFYGFAVKIDENSNAIPVFSENDISEIYKRYIVPVWNDTAQRTQTPLSFRLNEKSFCNNATVEAEYLWNNSVSVFSGERNLYETLLYKALTGDIISYCSCINDYKALKKSPFNYVVTSKNNLTRIKNDEIAAQVKPAVIDVQNNNENHIESDKISDNEDTTLNSDADYANEFEGSKKNKSMYEDSFLDKEAFSEKELASDLENLFKKYFKSAVLVSLAVSVAVAVITSILKLSNQKKEDDENAK